MLELFKRVSLVLLVVFIWLECAFFFSWVNLFGCFVILYGWIFLSRIILKKHILIKHPVIFIVSLGLGVFYFYFPLVGTLLANRPLTYNFRVPFEVFIHQFIYINAYIIAFVLYVKSDIRPRFLRNILKNSGAFKPPSDGQLWIMGILGVCAFLYVNIIIGVSQLESEDVTPFVRFINPIINFIYAPLLLLFKDLYSRNDKRFNKKYGTVFIYIIGIIIMSLLGNGRQFMISSIMVLLLLFVFDKFLSQKTVSIKWILIFTSLGVILFGPLARMANAMLMVRDVRTDISAIELFEATLSKYDSKELDDTMKNIELAEANFEWVEDYTGNVFFDRLCNLKIADMTLYYESVAKMSTNEAHLVLMNQIISFLPSPVLNLLNLNFNKYDTRVTNSATSNFTLKYLHRNYGGQIVSGHTGTGILLFRNWYPLFFILIYFILFYLFDSFILYYKNRIYYSPIFLLNIYFFFSFLNFKNGIYSDILFMGRPYIQMCILYIIIYYFTKKIDNLSKV